MAKYGSASFGVLLVDGYNLLAAKVKTFSHKVSSVLERSEGLGDTTFAQTPTGLSQLEVTQAGAFFDDATDGAHALLSPAGATQVSRTLVAAFAGNAIGRPFLGASGTYGSDYEVLSQVGALTKANVKYAVTGALDRGVILQAHAAVTADGDNTSVDYTTDPSQRVIPITSNSVANPTVVTTSVPHGLATGDLILISGSNSTPTIDGQRAVTVISATTFSVPINVTVGGTAGSFVRANSSGGGVGYQVASAFSGLTGYIGTIRDSADDVVYADLVNFTNVTSAPNTQRLEVAGIVDRYLRYTRDVTGTGSVTVFAGFKRT